MYSAACIRAVTASLQAKAPEANASRLAKEDADKAVVWLTKAVAAGRANSSQIKEDTRLDFLRDREDFQALLRTLKPPELAPPPRAKKV